MPEDRTSYPLGAGAFRNIGCTRIADDTLKSMRAAGYTVTEVNPFEDNLTFTLNARGRSPYINRIHTYWESLREQIIEAFPGPPGLPTDKAAYLKQVDDIYVTDAYHSLSIEGDRVTMELVERVRSGDWNPDQVETDRQHRDAMAACDPRSAPSVNNTNMPRFAVEIDRRSRVSNRSGQEESVTLSR